MKQRCSWPGKIPIYIDYHDSEWGIPVHDDNHLFELICLEGQQAGLSWITVLKKRAHYRQAFFNFDPITVAGMTDETVETLLLDANLIRNRLKLYSIRNNASAFLAVQQEFGSFDRYIWAFVNGNTIQNNWSTSSDVPASTEQSLTMSKDLKKRGFKFIGSTICYAFMQSAGLVNDHVEACFRHRECQ
ncbi:MAG: DNA-3-methyladenine glycosylase I [Alteromonadaceae bacterium]|jgi:DNA-3-methyladenine glycosylase I